MSGVINSFCKPCFLCRASKLNIRFFCRLKLILLNSIWYSLCCQESVCLGGGGGCGGDDDTDGDDDDGYDDDDDDA